MSPGIVSPAETVVFVGYPLHQNVIAQKPFTSQIAETICSIDENINLRRPPIERGRLHLNPVMVCLFWHRKRADRGSLVVHINIPGISNDKAKTGLSAKRTCPLRIADGNSGPIRREMRR